MAAIVDLLSNTEHRLLPAGEATALSVANDEDSVYPSKDQMAVWDGLGDILLWVGIRISEMESSFVVVCFLKHRIYFGFGHK